MEAAALAIEWARAALWLSGGVIALDLAVYVVHETYKRYTS